MMKGVNSSSIAFMFTLCSESELPPAKKMKTSSVVVEQTGQSDKLLIDQVTDVDSIFDEVGITN